MLFTALLGHMPATQAATERAAPASPGVSILNGVEKSFFRTKQPADVSHTRHDLVTTGPSGQGPPLLKRGWLSVVMHRSSGAVVLIIGVLVLLDRLTQGRIGVVRIGIGFLWLHLGIYSFVWGDPAAWPIGPPGFMDSFLLSTASQWLQHKLLSLLSFLLGLYILLCVALRHAPFNLYLNYAIGSTLAAGGALLLVHQHANHPTMDLVNVQHRFMALTALLIAASAVGDESGLVNWRCKGFLVPGGLILLGLQLLFYVE